MKNNQDHFNILRKIDKNAYLNQRVLAKDLGLSLGKLNYCLNSLKKKGFVKLQNFKSNPNRFNHHSKNNYLYILTPKGVAHKIKLTINFMKKKMQEYDELKKDLEKK
ncbi:MarR family EPS-associated transcriptional regulator [Candidatus Pelagibacter ubique]|nr:MarR family EPS-associated transcriptional regulator [Candidatus Pelagibacter ubique]